MSEITDNYVPSSSARRVPITAQAGQLAGTGSKTATYWIIDENVVPSAMIDSDQSSSEASGAPTLRASSDIDGENMLGLHIVNFSPASGGVGGGAKAQIRVNLGTYTGGSAVTIYLWWIPGGSQTQPAEDAAFGSESVYSTDYIADWKFTEDPSGGAPQMADSTSNDNDGTSFGTMTSGDQVDLKFGSGIDFDGVNDAIEIPDSASLKIDTTNGITVGFWFNSTSQTNYRTFMGKRQNGLSPVCEWIINKNESLNRMQAQWGASFSGIITNWTPNFSNGTDYFLVCTFAQVSTDVVTKMYKNGSEIASDTTAGSLATNTSKVAIGATKYGAASQDEEVRAKIALPFMFDSVLDSDEISTLYNNQNSPSTFWSTGSVSQGPFAAPPEGGGLSFDLSLRLRATFKIDHLGEGLEIGNLTILGE